MAGFLKLFHKHWVSRQVYLPGDPTHVFRGDGTFSQESAAGSDPRQEPVQEVSTSGSSLTIDYSLGSCVFLSLGHTITSLSVTNWPASGLRGNLVLEIVNAGAFTISDYPAGSLAQDGVVPTIGSGAGKKSTVVLRTIDGGAGNHGGIHNPRGRRYRLGFWLCRIGRDRDNHRSRRRRVIVRRACHRRISNSN